MLEGDFRITVGDTEISGDDLRPWGELRGWVAWSILCFAETQCRDKAARMELLEFCTDDVIDGVLNRQVKEDD